MSPLKLIGGILLLTVIFAVTNGDEMQVKVLYKPRVCMKKSQTNNMLTVQYKVFFENGTLFHSSYEDDVMMHIPLGFDHPSSDLEIGFRDMCVGEKRLLTIPHHGQGDRDLPLQNGDSIPANTPIVYEVELIKIEDKVDIKKGFESLDADNDNHISAEELIEQIKVMQNQSIGLGLAREVLVDIYRNLMNEADADKDGRISREEYRDILPQEYKDEL
ncbi:uncharacterized protein LOC111127443 [Crassostrea virginica]